SNVRVSPGAGATPSATSASRSAAVPSSAATSRTRTVSPPTCASGATTRRSAPATVATSASSSAAPSVLGDDAIRHPQHLVGGLDRLRRHLVRALPGDEAHQLLDDAHVRALEESLEERAAVLLPRRPELRRARRLALLEQVLAERPQAGGI